MLNEYNTQGWRLPPRVVVIYNVSGASEDGGPCLFDAVCGGNLAARILSEVVLDVNDEERGTSHFLITARYRN
jgi:hypothetical protein